MFKSKAAKTFPEETQRVSGNSDGAANGTNDSKSDKEQRKLAERKRKEEEARQQELAKQAAEDEKRRKKGEEEKRRAEEKELKEKQRMAREEEIREARAAEEAEKKNKKLEEQKQKEEERLKKEEEIRARQESARKRKEDEIQRREIERRAVEEEKARKSREAAEAASKPGVSVAAPQPKASSDEERKRLEEIASVLSKVTVRYPVIGTPIPPTWKAVEKYPVNSPFAYAVVSQSPLGAKRYFLDEVPLNKVEAGIYSYLLDALENELTVPRTEVNPRQYFADQARRILLKYSIIVPSTSWAKIIYFAERDLVGFGVIDGLMRDPNIEDISLDAVGKPIFVYHKSHESLETNITLNDDETLDNMVTRLSHMAGKHVSTAFPIVQGTLPGRHRLVATFRREISPLGSTATIRKFREDPLTIIDMLNLNVLDHRMAAYIWLMMQNRATAIVVGATGAGKTTLLNALLTLTRLNTKVVTIEEVQEINISHQNWASLVSRESYAATEEKAGAVDLFTLVKAAMRMRPDILVVGEIRGEEAYVLFQAISTGHGGICTLHADDTASALQRLTSAPMNVPPAFIPFLDLSIVVRRLSVPTPTGGFKSIRRILSIDEIATERETHPIFTYMPNGDTFRAAPWERSAKIVNLAREQGISVSDVVDEIEHRSVVLKWLQQKGIRNFKEVSPILELFASRREETYERAANELKAAGVPLPTMRTE